MNNKKLFLLQNTSLRAAAFAFCSLLFALCCASAADVVQRNTVSTNRATPAPRANMASRMPTLKTTTLTTTTVSDTETDTTSVDTTQVETAPVVEEKTLADTIADNVATSTTNKSAQFGEILDKSGASGKDTAADSLAEMIRRQRETLDAGDAIATAQKTMTMSQDSGLNACDSGLRGCMRGVCGNDFSKCFGDGDTIWGNKISTCRRDTKCSGEEFTVFAKEIKADRDLNYQLSAYTNVLKCGDAYKDCIEVQCGTTFNKCLGKPSGDRAIAKCAPIAKDCVAVDSGLPSRTMQVFGILRQGAEAQAARDEAKLYELRASMADQCKRLGAAFDERSLDCVYTVNMFSEVVKDAPTASRNLYAGSLFDCIPDWFGVDITTALESADRITLSQKGASSALMGAGFGAAAGMIGSGAVNRAIDTATAKSALKDAQAEHKENFGGKIAEANKPETPETPETKPGATEPAKPATSSVQKTACEISKENIWSDTGDTCICKNAGTWDPKNLICIAPKALDFKPALTLANKNSLNAAIMTATNVKNKLCIGANANNKMCIDANQKILTAKDTATAE